MSHHLKDLFGTVDYVVLAALLVISSGIGIWYAYADRKRATTQHFLMGGRSLGIFPVAMSVFASIISGITILGGPAEVYRYGTQYVVRLLGLCFAIPTTIYLYQPVYYNLGLTSAYEYLELRFHRLIRLVGSAVFILYMIISISVVLYAPALALSEVTGIDLPSSVITLGAVCTFYTSIGGMKAVIWTDVFQAIMMFAALIVILIKGIADTGGLQMIWERSIEGQRIEFFRFDLDPTIRHTFWSLVFGGYVTMLAMYAANQTLIQRYLTIGTLKGAQMCLWINIPASLFLVALTTLAGLVVYAYYSTCDPIGAKIVNKPDQVFPRFVMEVLGSQPGFPGFFVSGVFSGALSTCSSGVNSLAAVVLEDFIKGLYPANLSEAKATRISKILAVAFGLLSIAFVFVAQKLGGILQVAMSIHGIVGGPMLGLFTLGLFFPYSNALGAAIGLFNGFVVSIWFGAGSFVNRPYNQEPPRSYQSCQELFYNVTDIDLLDGTLVFAETHPRNEHIFYPYKLSYMWLSCIGFLVVLVTGNIASLCARSSKRAESKYLSPLVNWLSKTSSAIAFDFSLKAKEKATASELQSMTVEESCDKHRN